jgi:hypothetical protein
MIALPMASEKQMCQESILLYLHQHNGLNSWIVPITKTTTTVIIFLSCPWQLISFTLY